MHNDAALSLAEKVKRSLDDPAWTRRRLQHQLSLVGSINPAINAFLNILDEEDPLTAAKADVCGEGLAGLSFAVKGNIACKGLPLSFGLKSPLCDSAKDDAALVKLCRQSGARCLGNTILDPVCADYRGENPWYGTVKNPSFSELITGGSSAGSAAAVAASLVDFALGTDFGGSVRLPAACCGITGFLPGERILPSAGIVLWDELLDRPGILAQTPADVLFVMQALCPAKNWCGDTLKYKFIVPAAEELEGADPHFKQVFYGLVERWSAVHSIETTVEWFGFKEALKLRLLLAAKCFLRLRETGVLVGVDLPKQLCALEIIASKLSEVDYQEARDRQRLLQAQISLMLRERVYILTPALPYAPTSSLIAAGENNGVPLNYFQALANAAGLPAASVPCRQAQSPWPFPIQILGAPGDDTGLLAAANQLERSLKAAPLRGSRPTGGWGGDK